MQQGNNSPWIEQLKRTRPVVQIAGPFSTDVAIIGGGIAGISTAYFTLKNTQKKVAIIEGGKIAHGATGHNAGQLVSYFERQIADLVEEFGLNLAAEGQTAVDSAWLLIEEIYRDAKLQTPLYQFTGYAGLGNTEEVLVHLKNSLYSKQAGLNDEQVMISEESGLASELPKEFKDLYTVAPQKDILSLLETHNTHYVGAVSARKGCMNSALFCEELVGYLLTQYPERFTLAEESYVKEIVLESNKAQLIMETYQIDAGQVVLCTNGFEKFTLTNKVGKDIDVKFHQMVRGSVGYMAAYLAEHDQSPVAISYLPDKKALRADTLQSDPYFYITRRPYENEKKEKHNLISVGGPESIMDDTNNYTKEHLYPSEAQEQIDHFLHRTYKHAPKEKIDYKFRWHGLMGYTPNGVRLIGPEPHNPILFYNLGCNGVGILPSIYGGQKISWFLAGKQLPPSIFDPRT